MKHKLKTERKILNVNSKVQNSCNKYEFFTALLPACFHQTSPSLGLVLRDGEKTRIELPCSRPRESIKKVTTRRPTGHRNSGKTLLFHLRCLKTVSST